MADEVPTQTLEQQLEAANARIRTLELDLEEDSKSIAALIKEGAHTAAQNAGMRRSIQSMRKALRGWQDKWNIYMGAYARGGWGIKPSTKVGLGVKVDELVLPGGVVKPGKFAWRRDAKSGDFVFYRSVHNGMYYREVCRVEAAEANKFIDMMLHCISTETSRQDTEAARTERDAKWRAEQAARVAAAETIKVPLIEAAEAAPSSTEPVTEAKVA